MSGFQQSGPQLHIGGDGEMSFDTEQPEQTSAPPPAFPVSTIPLARTAQDPLTDEREGGDDVCDDVCDGVRDGVRDGVCDCDGDGEALEATDLLGDMLAVADSDAVALLVLLGDTLGVTVVIAETLRVLIGDTLAVADTDAATVAEGEAVCDAVVDAHTGGTAASIATCAAVSARSHTRRSSRSCGVVPRAYTSPPKWAALPFQPRKTCDWGVDRLPPESSPDLTRAPSR